MLKLAESQSKLLQTAVTKYHGALPGSEAEAYLESRGLPLNLVEKFRLGFVSEPAIGHELFRGRLAIPYLRKSVDGTWNVVTIKFRKIDGVQCQAPNKKYLALPGTGGKPRLFNTNDAIANEDEIAIAEGELDALAASVYGIPCVGAPGATTWQEHFTEIFLGYHTVWILCDGDDAGLDFGNSVAKGLTNARVIPMDYGEDVNSTIHKYGVDKIKERMGK